MKQLWDKGLPIDRRILEFTVGEDYVLDRRLVKHDVRASIAHVRMLGTQGLLQTEECSTLISALAQAEKDFDAGLWSIEIQDEDAHTALELYLSKKLGYLGGKVHLGRSRNDQVLTAIRLYLLDVVEEVSQLTYDLSHALFALGNSYEGVRIPGYTHLQQAMPSSVKLWADGFASELLQSSSALELARQFALLNPLGSAAGYGTPGLNLDREQTTKELGFSQTQTPVTACQLSRGKAESALAFALNLILGDIGRLSADMCLFATQEFGFVTLDGDISTGSSIMPQKRNPDVFELLRGHSVLATADLTAILSITAKLTSGYHRDLQLIKGPLFRAIDRTIQCLDIAAYAITKLKFNQEKIEASISPGIFAAEAAFKLVQDEGISFREAYQRVAKQLTDPN